MHTIIGNDLRYSAALLGQGAVVAIPTETVYGLAANALNHEAVLKIFEAKNRPHFNPLIVHCKNWEHACQYAQSVPEIAHLLAKHFCPGPLTFLLPKKNTIPDLVTSGSDLVALRIPHHPLTLSLLDLLEFPLAAPSANQFGYISPTTAGHVYESLNGKIPYIMDGGPCSIGLESTIIGFQDDQIIVHRVGGIEIEAIEKISGAKTIRVQELSNPSRPTTAGQLKSHYAPHTDLIIGEIPPLFEQYKNLKLGLISFSDAYPELNFEQKYVLSPKRDLHEAAQNLFSSLRNIDGGDLDLILAEQFPNEGLGAAINDRLHRAQSLYKK